MGLGHCIGVGSVPQIDDGTHYIARLRAGVSQRLLDDAERGLSLLIGILVLVCDRQLMANPGLASSP